MAILLDLPKRVAFGVCGSFCSISAVVPQIEELTKRGWEVLPVLSGSTAVTDTRFGKAAELKEKLKAITGVEPLENLTQVEPLGPKKMVCAMLIAPCTGTTMSLLAAGNSGTAVTLAAKSVLRGGLPVVLAPSTNDGLSGSAVSLATLMQRKQYYFVPFGQDDSFKKPASLKSDFSLIPDTLESALRGVQIQPILL